MYTGRNIGSRDSYLGPWVALAAKVVIQAYRDARRGKKDDRREAKDFLLDGCGGLADVLDLDPEAVRRVVSQL